MLLRRGSREAEALQRVPFFRELGGHDLEKVGQATTEVRARAGDVLAREGGLGREFVLIVEGAAAVTRGGQLLANLGAGDFFGELSLLDGGPRSATVTATTDAQLLVVDGRSFWPLLETVPALLHSVVESLSARLREALAAMEERGERREE
ncbi:MAG: cyclic nucleotide-binding domain-containing protein [Dehalococcoidia bacterium]|nr:cyclic nucleotide-binding domain-containing protein [Dehalococcoidia bacterium]